MDINITIIGQMITFIIFVVFTMQFVWPPLKKCMDDRRAKIAEGLLSASRAEKELQSARKKAEHLVAEARRDARKIIDQANSHANQIDEKAKKSARISYNNILKSAHDEAEAHIISMKHMLREEFINTAIISAEKLIQKNIDTTTNNRLLEEMLKKF